MPGEIAAAIASFKAAGDILSGLLAARDLHKFSGDLIKLQTEIIAAQSGMLSLQQDHAAAIAREDELKKRIMDMENWKAEAARYALQPDREGSFFYALKETMANGEPPHRICATCYAKGKKSFLQPGDMERARRTLVCSTCRSTTRYLDNVVYAQP